MLRRRLISRYYGVLCVAVGGDVDDTGSPTLRTIEVLGDEEGHWEHVVDFPNQRRGFSTCAGNCHHICFLRQL